ncbi:PhzF family phenazine biosynthesis protein [Algivirga pacifica]|uniref:PhzF family phenazine biosynthesis protein n=1 Tax=Algivirga pacifica TaxID=1162670 RepID=A0ABP9DF83_9BACT
MNTTNTLPIYQVDAFAYQQFKGNPAAVCLLGEWLEDELLQNIAAENNLSETAFIVTKEGAYSIRWFTPTTEVDLCGHATMAAAHVLFEHLQYNQSKILFNSPRSGVLEVTKEANDRLTLNFPAQKIEMIPPSQKLDTALGTAVHGTYKSSDDIMIVVGSENEVRHLTPNLTALGQLPYRGIIVTAKGDTVDFVSRFFGPAVGIEEDPVTGSAHTKLIPYWAKKLGKDTLHAQQLSARGGDLYCQLQGDRVLISGRAVTYMKGEIFIR